MYINSSVCISYQGTFRSDNPIAALRPVDTEAGLQHPDYKEFISPAQIRRMSPVLKMGVAAGVEALKQAGEAEADAIIVGTGLGCIQDTLKFVEAMYASEEGTQSPTAFIQSTHNSIAGQLALLLGNRNYNMTHTQGNLSLACALLDARLLLSEGDARNVLVGAVDEMTYDERAMIAALADRFNHPLPILGEGSAFFHLSSEKRDSTLCEIGKIAMSQDNERAASLLTDTDLILTNAPSRVSGTRNICYTDFCGEYFTSPGFGLWLAVEHLKADHGLQRIIVHHVFGPQEMGIEVKRA